MRTAESAIAAATTGIVNDCHRDFTVPTENTVMIFGTSRRQSRELSVPDLVSLNELLVDDDDDGAFETTITAYELDTYRTEPGWPFEMVRLVDRDWPRAGNYRRRVSISAMWGWAAIPEPINQACSLLAQRLMQRPESAPLGVQSFGELGTQSIRANDPDYKMLIEPYIRPGIA